MSNSALVNSNSDLNGNCLNGTTKILLFDPINNYSHIVCGNPDTKYNNLYSKNLSTSAITSPNTDNIQTIPPFGILPDPFTRLSTTSPNNKSCPVNTSPLYGFYTRYFSNSYSPSGTPTTINGAPVSTVRLIQQVSNGNMSSYSYYNTYPDWYCVPYNNDTSYSVQSPSGDIIPLISSNAYNSDIISTDPTTLVKSILVDNNNNNMIDCPIDRDVTTWSDNFLNFALYHPSSPINTTTKIAYRLTDFGCPELGARIAVKYPESFIYSGSGCPAGTSNTFNSCVPCPSGTTSAVGGTCKPTVKTIDFTNSGCPLILSPTGILNPTGKYSCTSKGLTTLDSDTFYKSPFVNEEGLPQYSISKINLSKNLISYLHFDTFAAGLPNLKIVDLSNNLLPSPINNLQFKTKTLLIQGNQ